MWIVAMTMIMKNCIQLAVLGWDKSLYRNQQKQHHQHVGCARYNSHRCISYKQHGLSRRIKSWRSDHPQQNANRLVDCCLTAMRPKDPSLRYSSNSFEIAIDNCATLCFTNLMEDYVGTPTKVNTNITGVGQAKATYVGTAKWLIVDNQGRKHELLIPSTCFQKDRPFCLLSPQHVAQVYNDPQTTCLTLMDKVFFEWGKGKWRRTLPLHQSSNVALMWSAPGYKKFYAFAAQYMPAHIIPDNDEEEEAARNNDDSISESIIQPSQLEEQTNDNNLPMTTMSQREQPVIIKFSKNVDQQQIKTPIDVTSKQAALRRCHDHSYVSNPWQNKACFPCILQTWRHQCMPAVPMERQHDDPGEPREHKDRQQS
jgi:hypothetical protein